MNEKIPELVENLLKGKQEYEDKLDKCRKARDILQKKLNDLNVKYNTLKKQSLELKKENKYLKNK